MRSAASIFRALGSGMQASTAEPLGTKLQQVRAIYSLGTFDELLRNELRLGGALGDENYCASSALTDIQSRNRSSRTDDHKTSLVGDTCLIGLLNHRRSWERRCPLPLPLPRLLRARHTSALPWGEFSLASSGPQPLLLRRRYPMAFTPRASLGLTRGSSTLTTMHRFAEVTRSTLR